MPAPSLVMVAGPNGSGKSTLIEALRAAPGVQLPEHYVNADDLQRLNGLDAATAQQAAAASRARAIAERRDVMYETVMSHPSKLGELQAARGAGYHIALHFVATEDPSINVHRVALRAAAGGHDVPENRTRERYGRTMALAPIAIGLADQALVFDNSRRGEEGGLRLQAQSIGPRLVLMTDSPARWAALLAAQVNDRAAELAHAQVTALDQEWALEHASLQGGRTEGPLRSIGTHFLVQLDRRSQVSVVHERSLLPAEVSLRQGEAYRIEYEEGVAKVSVR